MVLRHHAASSSVPTRHLTHGLEVSEAMLTELRRGLLGDLVPPEPVPSGLRPPLDLCVSPCGGAG